MKPPKNGSNYATSSCLNNYILFLFLTVVGACRNCTQQDFMTIQESCKDSDQKLIRAQNQFSKENETSLCK